MDERIGILGGTGDLGRGLALRWGRSVPIRVGSRDPARARSAADDYRAVLAGLGLSSDIDSGDSLSAAGCPVVVLAVPPATLVATLEEVASAVAAETIVISAVVPMERVDRVFRYRAGIVAPGAASAAQVVARMLPQARVVAALHTLPAGPMGELEHEIGADCLICGDDETAVQRAMELVALIEGVRPLRAGPLDLAATLEQLTPLALQVGALQRLRHPGISIVGEPRA